MTTSRCNTPAPNGLTTMSNLFRTAFPAFPALAPFAKMLHADDFFSNVAKTVRRKLGVDVFEDDNAFHVRVEAPGFTRKEVTLSLEDEMLTLRAEKAKPDNADSEDSPSETFERTLRVPDSVDPEKITAKLENGILTLTLPKAENAKPRSITID